MNEKTAAKLDQLLSDSEPVTLDATHFLNTGVQTAERIWPELLAIVKRYEPEFIRQEIIAAAKERRQTDTCTPRWDAHIAASKWAQTRSEHPWDTTRKLWDLARPEIDARLAAFNAANLAAYEAYRIACEQGVAVPPQS